MPLQTAPIKTATVVLAYENCDIDYQRYSARNAELKQREDQINTEKDRIIETLDDEAIILENPDAVLAYSKELVHFLRTEEPQRCRPWLTRFIKRIWIEPDWATVHYRIPLPEGSPYAGLTKRRIPLTNKVRPSTRLGPGRRVRRTTSPCQGGQTGSSSPAALADNTRRGLSPRPHAKSTGCAPAGG